MAHLLVKAQAELAETKAELAKEREERQLAVMQAQQFKSQLQQLSQTMGLEIVYGYEEGTEQAKWVQLADRRRVVVMPRSQYNVSVELPADTHPQQVQQPADTQVERTAGMRLTVLDPGDPAGVVDPPFCGAGACGPVIVSWPAP